MLEQALVSPLKTFDTNVKLAFDLMDFDRIVVDFATLQLQQRQEYLKKASILNQYSSLEPAIKQLKAIRDNDSLRPRYQAILNQGLVLLVSYFASTVSEVFDRALSYLVKEIKPPGLMKQKIELTVEDLRSPEFDLEANLGGLIIEKNDISFQDMKSISRSFKEYFDFEPLKAREVNNIIVAQACRHAIAHKGAVADLQLINQVKNALPRDVKQQIKVGESVLFSKEEIETVGKSMKQYLGQLCSGLEEAWK